MINFIWISWELIFLDQIGDQSFVINVAYLKKKEKKRNIHKIKKKIPNIF